MSATTGGWSRPRVLLCWPEGHPFHGLEIVCRRRPLADTLDRWRGDDGGGDALAADRWDEATPAERADILQRQAAEFVELIEDWNIVDRESGEVLLITLENFLEQFDNAEAVALWEAYSEGTSRLAPPLHSRSDAGSRSEAPESPATIELPTEPLPDQTTPDGFHQP
jgi:hypothetical protein